jgi:hypothetical protein
MRLPAKNKIINLGVYLCCLKKNTIKHIEKIKKQMLPTSSAITIGAKSE